MSADKKLRQDFLDLFEEKLDNIVPSYSKRRFDGVKRETSQISESDVSDIKNSFKATLLGEQDSDDSQET